jgi:simple sugar transport system ATP-binding protein
VTVPLLTARGITKRYGRVNALRGVDFDVRAGEVVALVGDNGAGKSTLVRVLSGATLPDGGEILLDGEPVRFDSPIAAQRLGIETVYQDLALAADLDPAANLFLGRELLRPAPLSWFGVLDRARMRRRSVEIFAELGVGLPDPTARLGTMSGGQRQSVAVARAVSWASKVVFMDEPTAALGVVQTRRVLDLIRRVRDRGVSVVLISHNMPEVMAVSDRVEVLRLGSRVARFDTADTDVEQLVGAMTGALGVRGNGTAGGEPAGDAAADGPEDLPGDAAPGEERA